MSAQIQAENSEHRYFTMMLNMAEDELDPFQYRLLAHYVRWSDKPRRESIRDTAAACKMSVAKVREVRRELAALGYIEVHAATEAQRRQGVAGFVTVKGRWLENINRYAQGVSDLDQGGVSNIDHNRRTREKKNIKSAPEKIGADTTGKKKKPAKLKKPQPYDDIPHEQRTEVIHAWVAQLQAAPVNAYAWTTNHVTAAEIIRAGYTAHDVERYAKAAKAGWYKDKTLTLQVVGRQMPEWLAANPEVVTATVTAPPVKHYPAPSAKAGVLKFGGQP